MGTDISAGSGLPATFCLNGFRRVVVGLTGDPPVGLDPAEIYIELSFRVGQSETGPLSTWIKDLGTPDDRVVIAADLGSYRVRPFAGARLVAPRGTWNVLVWQTPDPCLHEETFWRTIVVPPGAWIPPRFYHRLRILSGSISYRGAPLVNGFDLGMPNAGNSLTAAESGAVVQVGFKV